MSLSHEHIESKILAKIKIYILSRAKLLFTIWDEIPCTWKQFEYHFWSVAKLLVKFKRPTWNSNIELTLKNNLLKNNDSHIEVMMFHCWCRVDCGQRWANVNHELIVEASVVEVVANGPHKHWQTLESSQKKYIIVTIWL